MGLTNLTPATPGAGTNGLRDIRPPVEIPTGWEWLWWVAAAIVAAVATWLAWRYWKAKAQAKPVGPAAPPHLLALRRLQDALALLDSPREFCIAVSDAIRWYLEERFAFRAPERTTEEFLRELQGSPLLTSFQKRSLEEFLERCDLVKFARYEPARPELSDLHASATRLVEETRPPVSSPGPAPE